MRNNEDEIKSTVTAVSLPLLTRLLLTQIRYSAKNGWLRIKYYIKERQKKPEKGFKFA